MVIVKIRRSYFNGFRPVSQGGALPFPPKLCRILLSSPCLTVCPADGRITEDQSRVSPPPLGWPGAKEAGWNPARDRRCMSPARSSSAQAGHWPPGREGRARAVGEISQNTCTDRKRKERGGAELLPGAGLLAQSAVGKRPRRSFCRLRRGFFAPGTCNCIPAILSQGAMQLHRPSRGSSRGPRRHVL